LFNVEQTAQSLSPGEPVTVAAQNFDVIVIGAGPGGYVAAIRASQLGLKVAIVEREHMGGICLNWGCIPTKAMLRSSEVFHLMHRAKDFGLSADNISYDLDAVVKRSRGVAKQLNSGVGHLMKKNKVTVVMGEATLPAKGKVSVKTDKGTEELTAKNIILATGARARELPGLEADGKRVWTYKHALTPAAYAEETAGHRLGRHRHRIRQLLQHAGRRHDRGRGHGPHPAGGGRGDLQLRQEELREAGHEDHVQGHGQEARPRRRQGHGPYRGGRQGRDAGVRHRHLRRGDRGQYRRGSGWRSWA
jgi:hypothetical protein